MQTPFAQPLDEREVDKSELPGCRQRREHELCHGNGYTRVCCRCNG